jgi:outer membrane protein OmpA-like peptidoglycan-associated protein
MQMNCGKCGGLLPDGQAFCTVCGVRRDAVPTRDAGSHCTGCGAILASGLRFCTQCGVQIASSEHSQTAPPSQPGSQWTPMSQPSAASVSSYVPPPPVIQSGPLQTATPVKRRSNFVFKLAIAVVAILVLGGVAVAGGIAYLGYVAKKRITAAKQAYQKDDYEGVLAAVKGKEAAAGPNDTGSTAKNDDGTSDKKDLLGGLISAVSGGDAKPDPLPEWKPAPAELVSSPPVRIPLMVSLQIDDVGTDRTLGDFESVYKIDKLNAQALHIKAAQQYPKGQGFARFLSGGNDDSKADEANKIDCSRTVLMKDLANSTETDSYFCRQGRNELHAGTTAMLFSKKTFGELKDKGQSAFILHDDPLHAVFKSFKAAMTAPDNDKAAQDAAAADLMKKMMNFAPGVGGGADPMDTPPIPCMLRRDGPDVVFPVMVNGQPTQVPAMKVTCKPEGSDHEGQLLVLDETENPLILAAGSSAGGHTQVTSISWDQPKQNQSELAQELEKDGRAKVYDLYFDFRSDVLRPESDKVLAEIAQVMTLHPDWTLGVEGNTDNIGGDQYNLDLSQRRAAAVKSALVKQYRISAQRLETAGFGASHPIDTNETIEGRARNRRVELVRR